MASTNDICMASSKLLQKNKKEAASLKHQASSAKLNEELEGLQRYVKNTKQPI